MTGYCNTKREHPKYITKTYKKKSQIMKNVSIYTKWSNFINNDKYKILSSDS